MPRPDTFTIFLNSVLSGFFVILKTRLHSIIKDFNLGYIFEKKNRRYIKVSER